MTSRNTNSADGTEQTKDQSSDRLVDNLARRKFMKSSGVLATTAAIGSASADSAEQRAVSSTAQTSSTREFTVHAIPVDIVHDRFGLHRPAGAMYVLDEHLQAAQQASGVAPDESFDLIEDPDNPDGIDTSVIEPLTIRAIQGETVSITLVNHLDRPVSMHQTALPYDVDTSDGLNVGNNDDSTVPAGDPVRIRNVMAVYEEQHNFGIPGVDVGRVQDEPEDQMAEVIGTSEAYTYTVQADPDFSMTNPDDLPIKDHLYGSMIADDLWDGMWGVFRSFGGEVDHVHPLPDRGAPSSSISESELAAMGHPEPHSDPRWIYRGHEGKLIYGANEDRTLAAGAAARNNENIGEIPPIAPGPGSPGQNDGVREYNVTAIQTDIPFNDYGDHDPHGITFVLDEHVDAVRAGDRHPEPLVLRANEGELVRVTLTNDLPNSLDQDHNHPQMRTRIGNWDVSNRTSLHPLHITNDVQGSDGATIGFNYDQTIAPGESVTYEWLADGPNDGCVLWDMADVRGHRHHGAFGQLVVEPGGSTWTDPETGEQIRTGSEAVIQTDGGSFREFALSFSDGRHIVNDDGTCVVPAPEDDSGSGTGCNQVVEPEDQGYVAINNRSEPFQRRFTGASANQAEVFSSDVHGDPDTQVLEANVGDDVVFRVANTADRPRGVAFHLSGHQWKRYAGVDDGNVASPRVGVEFGLTPGKAVSLEPIDGAGGVNGGAGDYIYQEMKHRRRLEAGWWGIFRVNE